MNKIDVAEGDRQRSWLCKVSPLVIGPRGRRRDAEANGSQFRISSRRFMGPSGNRLSTTARPVQHVNYQQLE